MHGISGIGAVLLVLALIIAAPIIWFIYCQLHKAYWDNRVDDMCEKDGGVTIYERVHISPAEERFQSRAGGKLSVAKKDLADPRSLVYVDGVTTYIKKSNPNISRYEGSIIRRADQKTIARWVYYARVGGDFPSPAHPSSYGCPDLKKSAADLEKIFILEGNKS